MGWGEKTERDTANGTNDMEIDFERIAGMQ